MPCVAGLISMPLTFSAADNKSIRPSRGRSKQCDPVVSAGACARNTPEGGAGSTQGVGRETAARPTRSTPDPISMPMSISFPCHSFRPKRPSFGLINTVSPKRLLISVYRALAMVASGVFPLQDMYPRCSANLVISPVVINLASSLSTWTAAALKMPPPAVLDGCLRFLPEPQGASSTPGAPMAPLLDLLSLLLLLLSWGSNRSLTSIAIGDRSSSALECRGDSAAVVPSLNTRGFSIRPLRDSIFFIGSLAALISFRLISLFVRWR